MSKEVDAYWKGECRWLYFQPHCSWDELAKILQERNLDSPWAFLVQQDRKGWWMCPKDKFRSLGLDSRRDSTLCMGQGWFPKNHPFLLDHQLWVVGRALGWKWEARSVRGTSCQVLGVECWFESHCKKRINIDIPVVQDECARAKQVANSSNKTEIKFMVYRDDLRYIRYQQ